jgi:electron transfer flavoprotein beta subunit
VISPFDENALEAALRIKDIHQSEVTVISMGRNLSKAVLRKSLAVGADELVLLEDDAFDSLDSYATAFVLSAAIRKIGKYDLIFTGRQAADWDAGQVGSGIAELLGITSVTIAKKVELPDGRVKVARVLPDGYQVIEAALPVLITVGNELGELRTAALPQLMAAQKQPIISWNADDLGLGVKPSEMRRTRLLQVFMPAHETRCEFVEGEIPEEAGANLALKLREAKII